MRRMIGALTRVVQASNHQEPVGAWIENLEGDMTMTISRFKVVLRVEEKLEDSPFHQAGPID